MEALNGISFAVDRGDFFGLLGPNGAGKSTTINVLLGLILADSGRIQIFESDLATQSVAIRRRMNVAAAFTSMNGVLTVRENLGVYGRIYGVKRSKKRLTNSWSALRLPTWQTPSSNI